MCGVISLTDTGAIITKIPSSVCLAWHRKPMSAHVKGFFFESCVTRNVLSDSQLVGDYIRRR